MKDSIIFKIADRESEFQGIHRLNYETFVEEIPQHEKNEDRVLVDRFHQENTYFIALDRDEVIGMLAYREKRPFSLDQKLKGIDSLLPDCGKKCEIRLLAIKKRYRRGKIIIGLFKLLKKHLESTGCKMALISGILNQQHLYRHIGFKPFGPLVGDEHARFQPMYLMVDKSEIEPLLEKMESTSFLPGPVQIPKTVSSALCMPAISHRSKAFREIFDDTRRMLLDLVNARHVQIFMGSGTLSNDVVFARTSLLSSKGLILANGEFGNRIIRGAKRFGLKFDDMKAEYGNAFDYGEIEHHLDENPDIKWVLMVHCETSTGVLNDLERLKEICKKRGVKLCLDAVSSTGNVSVDLDGVYLASCVSGKGLSSYCGLGIVFYDHELEDCKDRIPNYLDLKSYSDKEGIAFTISSNLVYALHESLSYWDFDQKIKKIDHLHSHMLDELEKFGIHPLCDSNIAAPSVTTIVVPKGKSSRKLGDLLKSNGLLVSYESSYLIERNWIQVCFMGETDIRRLDTLISLISSFIKQN